MEAKETIRVFIETDNKGQTVCICHADNKGCDKNCKPDVVERDRYRDWEKLFKQDKYGKSRFNDY